MHWCRAYCRQHTDPNGQPQAPYTKQVVELAMLCDLNYQAGPQPQHWRRAHAVRQAEAPGQISEHWLWLQSCLTYERG